MLFLSKLLNFLLLTIRLTSSIIRLNAALASAPKTKAQKEAELKRKAEKEERLKREAEVREQKEQRLKVNSDDHSS